MDIHTTNRPLSVDELPFEVDALAGVYKIYSDGGHLVGSRVRSSALMKKSSFPYAEYLFKDSEDDDLEDVSYDCMNTPEWVRLFGVAIGGSCYKGRTRGEVDALFDSLYYDAYINQGLRDKKYDKPLTDYIRDGILAGFPGVEDVDTLIAEGIKRKLNNLHNRKKRFRRKAYLNRWNYFVTFTYDEDKHTAEDFKRKLRKTLSNFHSRRGWRYMGVWERGEQSGHLHFHALVYVPDGEMPGKLEEVEEYSTKRHCMEKRNENTFFRRRYGINDFQPLNAVAVRYGRSIDYLLKYIGKTGERIVYSRGIPTEICKHLTGDDIITEMIDFYGKYVLFDDVIEYDEEGNVVRGVDRRPIVA